MKIGLFRFIGLLFVLPTMIHADRGHCGRDCDQKLDALSKTLFRVENTAQLVEASLNQYQTDCCESCADILRSTLRAPQCFCTTTTIYEPTILTESGAYCLANDITGNISTVGVQVSIDLKGHVVEGNVGVDEHGYVHNGTITGSLVLPSYSHAEQVTVGVSLLGAGAQNVFVRDVVLTNTVSSAINNFDSLTLDRCSFEVEEAGYPLFTINNVANLAMRNSKVVGDMWLDFDSPPLFATLAINDSQIAGEFFVYTNNTLSSLTVWDSSFGDFNLQLIDTLGSPAVLLHGLSCVGLIITGVSEQPHPNSRIMIDECNCEHIDLRDVSNIRCQNTLVSAPVDFQYQTLSVARCHQGVFENVSVFNKGTSGDNRAVFIFDCSNLLFKRCYASAENNRAFSLSTDLSYASTCVNFDSCVAKGSDTGFFIDDETSGSVIRCVADGCSNGFVDNGGQAVVYASNVACFNAPNYNVATETAPYYDAAYTVTAGSWRNMNL